ncbi:exonuclease [Echinicola pacifica]|uniref:Exonuclease n=1 Tax=Echinicola pacifica TaxID=346377 RepID=A0A918PZF6_9BACT|nr:exonuclease domain-containing protein [Echinicola pacifica]GGZ25741.1 exonuclease [Echinicola pacifica]
MIFAIVDIETTGGFGQRHRITEVAAIAHDGERILDSYTTLINPNCPIPGFITGLTGIDQNMVADAPYFEDIAAEFYEFLEDKVFVAHNVNFDYQFIKAEFARVGVEFDRPKLCTVRLSRKIFPGMGSYSLGRLCEQRGIGIEARHRAYGDAAATAELFSQLIQYDEEKVISQMMKRNSGEAFLPPNISKEQFLALPEEPGVYFFHDEKGKVIYVGKATNIRSRFKGHFTGASKGKQGLKTAIYDISYELTGSEFLALLVEALEIKKHWPKYNRAQKVKESTWGIYRYQDGAGLERFQVGKITRNARPELKFRSHHEAWSFLLEKIEKYSLCPKLCGVQKTAGACYDHKVGKCQGACCGEEAADTYNARVQSCFEEADKDRSKLLIREMGRKHGEHAAIYFEEGVLCAYGFVDESEEIHSVETVISLIQPVKPVSDTAPILAHYLKTNLHQKVLHLGEDTTSSRFL